MTVWTVDWQAWATLCTGIAAVGAAVYVGRKQTRIQNRLAFIEERKLRSDMFDRRMKVFEAASAWFAYILTRGSIPGTASMPQKGGIRSDAPPVPGLEEQAAFIDAMLMSRFLFRPAVYETLKRAWDEGERFTDATKSDATTVEALRERERVMAECRTNIVQTYMGLIEVFSPELNLADVNEPLTA